MSTEDVIELRGARYSIQRAVAADVPTVVALLADDVLGATRESGEMAAYQDAFAEIDADPNQFLAVVRDADSTIVGTFQLTLIPGLGRNGAKRLQIEAVRLAPSTRGNGLGSALMDWAHRFGLERGATLAQLTSDKSRTDAHRFYERLGYARSHEGFKRTLVKGD